MLRITLIVLVVLAALLVVSQLALPRLAERRLEDDLRATGEVRRVSVRAFPALKLLFERADRVEVRIGDARAGAGKIGDLIEMAKGTDELDARVATLQVGRFGLRDLRLGKRGNQLEGEALLSDAALKAALPPAIGFRPVDSGDGQLVLEATAGLLGLQATVRARLSAQDGALVIAPEGIPFGGLATLTVFRDPRVVISGVGATRTPDGYALTATGTPGP